MCLAIAIAVRPLLLDFDRIDTGVERINDEREGDMYSGERPQRPSVR